ncbi:MAG TPA: circadian clock protein KaiC [Tepidisphaeraceae bacterium]|nr:circadian clock protein KaiC [Tepidisphaeraceae bacterium]
MPKNVTKKTLEKVRTGIDGLDEITHGGFPKGRPTLICGGPGCGKSLTGIEFLVRGATEFGEPGVLMTFEETRDDIKKNIASLGFDLDQLIRDRKIVVDYVKVDRQEIDENGEYDLEGLFIRLDYAIREIGARRVMLDTIESLFSGLSNEGILRAELRRLFGWLKEKGMSTVITAEQGEGMLTRQGLEEYVSDCVILLDHRIENQVSIRRLRVVKYRGTTHGTNEYPFLIDEEGISVLPITSIGLDHAASREKVSTGVPRLDLMLGGKGLYRGSSVLITGTAGTGKSTLSAAIANACCERGERCLYFAFEESRNQIIRNTESIGMNLERHVKKGLLHFFNARPSLHGLEMHLAIMHKRVSQLKPTMVIIDPISNFATGSAERDVHQMLIRLVDFLKMSSITSIFTNLTSTEMVRESTDMGISSIMDTWILLRDIEIWGERNRGIYVLKSRGAPHSNQIREFTISENGIDIRDVYLGPEGVLTGSARMAVEAREKAASLLRDQEMERRSAKLERKRLAMEAQIAAIRAEFEAESIEEGREMEIERDREQTLKTDRLKMGLSRWADVNANGGMHAIKGKS